MTRLHILRSTAVVLLAGLAVCPPMVGWAGGLKQIEGLTLHGNEASDLLAVTSAGILAAGGWDVAFWTVLDEDGVDDGRIALVGRARSGKWAIRGVPAVTSPRKCKTDDSEALCRKGEYVYVIGSHFGTKGPRRDEPKETKKKAKPPRGLLRVERHFMARFRPSEVDLAAARPIRKLEIWAEPFRLHRAINDALRASRIPLIVPAGQAGKDTDLVREAFILDTKRQGLRKGHKWAGDLDAMDLPINIEGAAFLRSGALLLGLRYPVTAKGQPILVELRNADGLFASPPENPIISRVRFLENVGGLAEPTGIRAIRRVGDDIHVITGNLDSTTAIRTSLILAAHAAGHRAKSAHRVFRLPGPGGDNACQAGLLRTFPDYRTVEGLAPGPAGRFFYARDSTKAILIEHD